MLGQNIDSNLVDIQNQRIVNTLGDLVGLLLGAALGFFLVYVELAPSRAVA